MDDNNSRSRRQFLRAAGAGAVGALAGCLNRANADTFVEPTYDGGLPSRWEKQSDIERQETFGGGAVVAYIKGATYTDAVVRDKVADLSLGGVDKGLVIWNGSYINLEGIGAGAASPSDVLDSSKQTFEQQLRNNGITNVEETQEYVARADRVDAHTEYVGEVPVEDQAFDIPTPDGEKRTVTIDGEPVEIRAFIGVIDLDNTQDMVLVAGVYPAENFATTTSKSLSGDQETGVNVTIDIDLDLQPDAYRDQLLGLVNDIQGP